MGIIWTGSFNGFYTVKQGFLTASGAHNHLGSVDPFWKFLWSMSLPSKHLLFIWKLLHDAIPAIEVLQKHHLNLFGYCLFGCPIEESLSHLFISCPYAKAIWFGCFSIQFDNIDHSDFKKWLTSSLQHLWDKKDFPLAKGIVILINTIWYKRNKALHKSIIDPPEKVIQEITGQITFNSILPWDQKSNVPHLHHATANSYHHLPPGWLLLFDKAIANSSYKCCHAYICYQSTVIKQFIFSKRSNHQSHFYFHQGLIILAKLLLYS